MIRGGASAPAVSQRVGPRPRMRLARHPAMRLLPLSSDALDETGRGYPRPQLRRQTWYSLNGEWDFVIDTQRAWRHPDEVRWRQRIVVPFSPETPASGIGDTSLYARCWYRR